MNSQILMLRIISIFSISVTKFPKYVRINTLLTTVPEVFSQLEKDGWQLSNYDKNDISYEQFLDLVDVSLDFIIILI